jgi:hypothetical protein
LDKKLDKKEQIKLAELIKGQKEVKNHRGDSN